MDILIIDDHPLIVQAATAVIEALEPTARIRAAQRVEETEFLLSQDAQPDLVLLDLTLPGLSGLDALDAVAAQLPEARIVIFSAIDDASLIAAALRRGASGFIPKTSSRGVLAHALQLVIDGGIYVPPNILSLLGASASSRDVPSSSPTLPHDAENDPVAELRDQSAVTAQGIGSIDTLTDRQREIVDLLAGGLTTKQISRRLGISANTVKSHVAVIFRTLGVSNRAQAVAVVTSRRDSGAMITHGQ